MRHETYIDVLKSVFLTVVCLVFFPLLLPAISPSQDPNGAPENLLIFGEEEAEQSASIHHVDSLSEVSSDDPEWYIPAEIPDSLKAPFGVPENLLIFGEEEAEHSASISRADSRSGVSADANGAPENLLIFGEEEAERSASISMADSLSGVSADDDMSSAVDVSRSRDLETSDVASDDPEWYIPAEIPDSLKAPFGVPENLLIFGEEEEEQSASIHHVDSLSGVSADDRSPLRASAAECLTDSILTFNIDSVLTEATTYDYDAAGRTIRTTVWQYNADGSRTGKSKQEYAFDASGTQIYTGTFAWDAATNDWKGTIKSEYVYNEAHKMESNITYTWVNNTWLPSQALTYAYDAAGRETEFTTYARNASLNRLVPSKQRLQTWYNASKKTLEINYTAYTNGAWSAGIKYQYDYDANGNQIEKTYYSSYSGNDNWVGSTHEVWTYNTANKKTYYEKQTWSGGAWVNSSKELWEFNTAGKQTLHEKYNGSGTTWTITLREISGYDAAGNNTLVKNYGLSGTTWKGTKKEEYTFNAAGKKTGTIKYKWVAADTAFVYNTWAVSGYDAAGNANETANYTWTDNAWKGTGTRTLKTYNSSKNVTEQITQTWSTDATDWVNAARQTTTYSDSKATQEVSYTWQNGDWVGTTRTDWHYNTAGLNDTTMTYKPIGDGWRDSLRTVTTYSGNTAILTHNAKWNVPTSTWKMISMTRTDIIMDGEHQLFKATWHCGADSVWIGDQKDTAVYSLAGNILYDARFVSWTNNDWIPSYKVENKYDVADRLILSVRYTWTNNDWNGHYKYVYNYNESGQRLLFEYYGSWDTNTHDWIGSSKIETGYNLSGQTESILTYSWQNNTWILNEKSLYSYDDNGNQIEQIKQKYTSNGWVNSIRYEKAYKGSILVISNDYTWLNNAWQITQRNEKIYDEDASAKLRREIAGRWNNRGVLQSFTDKHYFYSCDTPTTNNGTQPRTPTELEEIDENNGNYENDDTNVQPFDPMLPTYNLQGQSVDPATYHGIVIQNGHTYLLP